MNQAKAIQSSGTSPSIFALLVDDINRMSESEQKLLWLQINRERLSSLANNMNIGIYYTRILEGETNATMVEDELNRVLAGVSGDIVGVQVVELQPNKEYKLFVTTK